MNKTQPVIIDNRYLLTSLHYQGSHSNFYNAIDTKQEQKSILIQIITDQHCICKLFKRLEQSIDNRDKQIDHHNRMSKLIPIPRIYKMGNINVQDINHHYIAWQKSGPSLKLCFKLMKSKFSIKTIALITLKMITNLQQIHSQNILHRNLNLSCIMTTNHSNLLITNFDNYVEFLNKNGNISTKKQVHIKVNKFSSLGQHFQQIPSPKDDLESLGYIALYLLSQGKQPPKCQTNEIKEKYYMEFKRQFLPEKELKQYPESFLQYFQSIHKLGLKEIPNYELLKLPFIQFLGRLEQDMKFDWNEIIKVQVDSPQTTHPSEAFLRDRNISIETLLIQNFNKDKDKDTNQSAPTSPKNNNNQKIKSIHYTLAPILEKNESVNTNQYQKGDSNCVSPKFNSSLANLMIDVCEQQSSSGEMTPKDDEPTVEELPSFEQHDHFM